MSVVACRITDGGWEIAADSIVVYGDHVKRTGQKLFDMGHLVFGASGAYSEVGVMRSFLSNHSLEDSSEISVNRLFSEFAEYKEKLTGSKGVENSYIFCLPSGRVYQIDGYHVFEVVDYAAIGYGAPNALTALALGVTAERAVEVTCEVSPYCSGPVSVMARSGAK